MPARYKTTFLSLFANLTTLSRKRTKLHNCFGQALCFVWTGGCVNAEQLVLYSVQASKHMPHSVYARPWIKREFPTPKQLFICEAISTSFTERDGMGTLEFWPGSPCVIWVMAYFCYLLVPTTCVEIRSLLSSPCQSSRSGMLFASTIPVHICPPPPLFGLFQLWGKTPIKAELINVRTTVSPSWHP